MISGTARESAKELKLFGLGPFLVGRYKVLSDELHLQNVGLARRKLMFGAFLTVLGTLGYYGGYAPAYYGGYTPYYGYGYCYRRVYRPAYAYYGGSRYYGGWHRGWRHYGY